MTQPIADPSSRAGRARCGGSPCCVSLAVRPVVAMVAIGWLFTKGIGIWGVNTTVVWGYAIANYVWWIGIGNAGTLISSMLLLTRQTLARARSTASPRR